MTAVLAVTLAVLAGHVVDRTTGQGLAHVRVTAENGAAATTDSSGRFTLRALRTGKNAITLESADVPVQHFSIRVGTGTTRHDFRACSTTLDYNCAGPPPGDSGSGST